MGKMENGAMDLNNMVKVKVEDGVAGLWGEELHMESNSSQDSKVATTETSSDEDGGGHDRRAERGAVDIKVECMVEEEHEEENADNAWNADNAPTYEIDGGWKTDERFLMKLGCIDPTRGRPFPFIGKRKVVRLSAEYRVTGFCEGEGGLPSMIEINEQTVLSLEPEVVGRVLGICSGGKQVPVTGDSLGVESYLTAASLRSGRWSSRNGVLVKSILPSLRKYIELHRKRLFLAGQASVVPVIHVYAFGKSMFRKKGFDWARHRVEYIKTRLTNESWRPLTTSAKDLLLTYITAALPCVAAMASGKGQRARSKGPKQKPVKARTPTPGQVIRRSTRLICDGSTACQEPEATTSTRPLKLKGSKRKRQEQEQQQQQHGEQEDLKRELKETVKALDSVRKELRAKEKEMDDTVSALWAIIDGFTKIRAAGKLL